MQARGPLRVALRACCSAGAWSVRMDRTDEELAFVNIRVIENVRWRAVRRAVGLFRLSTRVHKVRLCRKFLLLGQTWQMDLVFNCFATTSIQRFGLFGRECPVANGPSRIITQMTRRSAVFRERERESRRYSLRKVNIPWHTTVWARLACRCFLWSTIGGIFRGTKNNARHANQVTS